MPATLTGAPRVVSLVPSATEIVCAIPGGRDLLVGRSHECDFPVDVAALPSLTVSRTAFTSAVDVDDQVRAHLARGEPLYSIDEDALVALRPDLIITQDLCSVCSIDLPRVRALVANRLPGARIVSLNPQTLEGVLDDVLLVGEAVNRLAEARRAVIGLRERLHAAAEFVNPFADGPVVLFLEWCDPLYVGGHWTPQLIERAGGRHPLNPTEPISPAVGAAEGPIGQTQRRAGPSVRVPPEVIAALGPERVIICPCGLALPQARDQARRLLAEPWFASLPACAAGAARAGSVAVVDGSAMFNRPGPRLVDAFCWLVGWLNDRPDIIPAGFPWAPAAHAHR
ncbi:MAG: ABC transporter substrate-binding protein [Phycisphaerales bacterium]